MKTHLLPLVLTLSLLAITACDTSSSDALPSGYHEAVTRAFAIHMDSPVTGADGLPVRVRAFNGVDGSARSPSYESPLVYSQRSGVQVLRIPEGWGCKYTLDALFPDADADATDPDAYQVIGLNDAAIDLSSRGILTMWQTIYDIGAGIESCTSIDGVARGRTITGVAKWAEVVTRVADRLSRATEIYYRNPKVLENLALLGLKTGYIEFLPDALTTSGYATGGLSALFPVYTAWRTAFSAAPQNGLTRIQSLVAPSLPAAGAEDVTTPGRLLCDFLARMAQQPLLLPEVLSFLSNTASPEAHLALVQAVRAALDSAGWKDVQVADAGLRLSDEAWASLLPVHSTPARRSAYLAAFLASVKILAQDDLDLLVADRWGGPRIPPTAAAGEDLFQTSDGEAMPALLSLSPFFRMDQDQATRVQAHPEEWSADGAVVEVTGSSTSGQSGGDTVRVLAARRAKEGLTAVIVSLPAAIPAAEGVRMRYHLDIDGLPATPARWTMNRYRIDATSLGFQGAVEQSVVVPVDGKVRIVRDITGPAIDHVELIPVE